MHADIVWRMSTVTFDTLSFSKRLQAAGVPPAQAEAHAQVQAEFLTNHLLSLVATKEDIEAIWEEIRAIKEDVRATKEDIKQLETRLRMEMQLLGKTLTVRLGGIVALGVGALAALNQF